MPKSLSSDENVDRRGQEHRVRWLATDPGPVKRARRLRSSSTQRRKLWSFAQSYGAMKVTTTKEATTTTWTDDEHDDDDDDLRL